MAEFDLGDVIRSLGTLQRAVSLSSTCTTRIQFDAVFARFIRATDFDESDSVLPALSQLRLLASQVGDLHSMAGLHLAVARLEGIRGHFVDAHRHLEIARRCARQIDAPGPQCSVELVEASLECVAGNLSRSRRLAERCLELALSSGFQKYEVGALGNLALVALYSGNTDRASTLVARVLPATVGITYVRFGLLDTRAQICLFEGQLAEAQAALLECEGVARAHSVPARSWYDLAHQLTICAYLDQRGDWSRVVEICDDADPELARRQYKALRTSLLCAKARALAKLGQGRRAESALALAVRACPRGAVDPLIALEATTALLASLRGDRTNGAVHFERALAACRAIGHRYHEAWIERERSGGAGPSDQPITVPARGLDVAETALLMTDVATILGAGHSIDLLAHRMASILRSTSLGARVEVDDQSGCEYQAEPTSSWEAGADGTFQITLRGSDRRVVLRVRGVQTIDEISLLKSVADLVQAAVNRTADTESEDEDQNLWPRTVVHHGEDTIFRSPAMVELLKITARLAATNLPILITGETGTGKEIIARMIHDLSRVSSGPFAPFNCSALPRELVESQLFGHRRGAFTGATDSVPGVIRSAERGTLFLDEIGDLDPGVQPKFLRFLESAEIHPVGEARPRRVSVRIVAATNANLDEMVERGQFRRDLLYRIGVARVALPPLRDRKDEIPALAALFATRYARECGRSAVRLGDDLIAALLLFDWPGNIRQLANEIRRIVALAADGQALTAMDLAPEIVRHWTGRPTALPAPAVPTLQIRLDQSLHQAVADLEQRFIEHAMRTVGGRVADAAEVLGLSRKGLFLKRRRRGLIPN